MKVFTFFFFLLFACLAVAALADSSTQKAGVSSHALMKAKMKAKHKAKIEAKKRAKMKAKMKAKRRAKMKAKREAKMKALKRKTEKKKYATSLSKTHTNARKLTQANQELNRVCKLETGCDSSNNNGTLSYPSQTDCVNDAQWDNANQMYVCIQGDNYLRECKLLGEGCYSSYNDGTLSYSEGETDCFQGATWDADEQYYYCNRILTDYAGTAENCGDNGAVHRVDLFGYPERSNGYDYMCTCANFDNQIYDEIFPPWYYDDQWCDCSDCSDEYRMICKLGDVCNSLNPDKLTLSYSLGETDCEYNATYNTVIRRYYCNIHYTEVEEPQCPNGAVNSSIYALDGSVGFLDYYGDSPVALCTCANFDDRIYNVNMFRTDNANDGICDCADGSDEPVGFCSIECKLATGCGSSNAELSYPLQTDCPYGATYNTDYGGYLCNCRDGSGTFQLYELNDEHCECTDNSDEPDIGFCYEVCKVESCDSSTTSGTLSYSEGETDCIAGAYWDNSYNTYFCHPNQIPKDISATENCPYGAIEYVDHFGRSDTPPDILCKCANYAQDPSHMYHWGRFKDGETFCVDGSDECSYGEEGGHCDFVSAFYRPQCNNAQCTAEQLRSEYNFISNQCS